jgi:A nuclease family of the HNH/ENDO VII superfamily with conserved AHH
MKKFKMLLKVSSLLLVVSMLAYACYKQPTEISEPKSTLTDVEITAIDRAGCCPMPVPTTEICASPTIYTYTNGKKYVVRTSSAGNPGTCLFSKGYSKFHTDAVTQSYTVGTQCRNWTKSGTSIKFVDVTTGWSTTLGAIIGTNTSTHRAHHIIPQQVCDVASSLNPVIQRAGNAGFQPNDGYNGVNLLIVNHTGSHTRYTDWVLSQLERYRTHANYSTFSDHDVNIWVQTKLIPAALSKMNGAIIAYPNSTIQASFLAIFPLPSGVTGSNWQSIPVSEFIGI